MIPDRNVEPWDNIRIVATYLSDLHLVKKPVVWSRLKNDHETMIKKYSSRFDVYYTGCTVHAKMMMVNDDDIGYHHHSSKKKTIPPIKMKKIFKNSQGSIYLMPEEFTQHHEILKQSVHDNIISIEMRLTFREPMNDLMVRVGVDRNFDHWRFSGDAQWELLEYKISDRKETSKCTIM